MVAAFTSMDQLFLPQSAAGMISQRALSSSRIFRSGAVAQLPGVTLAPSNRKIILPYWNQPDDDSQILDEATDLEARAVTGDEMVAPVLARGLPYGLFDLQKMFVGEDPVKAVMDTIGDHWGRDLDKIAVATLTGFMNTVVTGGSMAGNVKDISALTGAAAYIDGDAIIEATGLMGEDQDTALSFVIMHPKVYTYAKILNLIETTIPSDGGDPIYTYQGKTVIVSKRAPTATVTGLGVVYTTILAGRGALGYAETPHPEGGIETVREGLKGGGRTTLISRKVSVLHPIGAEWLGTPVKQFASNAELATATNWTRKFDLENVRLVALKHLIPA